MNNKLDGQLSALEKLADKESEKYDKREFSTFNQWLECAKKVINVDEARHTIYYAFQPLYDGLLESLFPLGRRKKAKLALDKVYVASKEYLSGYYLGEPDVKIVRQLANEIEPFIKDLTPYRYKFRNVDYNGISTQDINLFMRTYISNLKNENKFPNTIIGCACGPAEIAFALGGILEIDVDFIRRSKRRDDENARIIRGQTTKIRKLISKKNVLVIEDYVVTSRSLFMVMEKTKTFGPSKLVGAAINSDTDLDFLDMIENERKFKLFKLSK
jgi:hypoxanthine phosphoribosyltransferase